MDTVNRYRFALAAAASIAVTVTACGTTTSNVTATTPAHSDQYQPPTGLRDATMVWSAEPGIDLLDANRKLVRATVEAALVANMEGPSNTYPGFAKAIDHDTAETEQEIFTAQGPQTVFGTAQSRIMSIASTDSGFTAQICSGGWGFAIRQQDGSYLRMRPAPTVQEIEFRRVPPQSQIQGSDWQSHRDAPPTSGTPPQQPAQWSAPITNVFTGWTIQVSGKWRFETDRPCDAWVHTLDPSAPAVGGRDASEHAATPPTALPAYPGW
ncbi:hypothetical protein GFY24_18925 [Nocardia sp. SYP-A9097]|uniref:hypothetical protein n=1 Tax=Nocardia sp. SYP-A9097 TaxID=2663237 RepID=UPI00129A77AD|nr:hypothetical protein [Nocardia sp. SYP-A9097]MRH89494.1 hypothetical protein [Nocardia sp. SYP-A9097]